MFQEEWQKLLSDYASKSRAFSDAVDRLQYLSADGEAFIRGLAETGTAHRACERSRIRLNKHLSQIRPPTSLADGVSAWRRAHLNEPARSLAVLNELPNGRFITWPVLALGASGRESDPAPVWAFAVTIT